MLRYVFRRYMNRYRQSGSLLVSLSRYSICTFFFAFLVWTLFFIAVEVAVHLGKRPEFYTIFMLRILGWMIFVVFSLYLLAIFNMMWKDMVDERRNERKNYGLTLSEVVRKEIDFEKWCGSALDDLFCKTKEKGV